jgi:hypothetical protein
MQMCAYPLWYCYTIEGRTRYDGISEDETMFEEIISLFDEKSPWTIRDDTVHEDVHNFPTEGFEELVGAAKELVGGPPGEKQTVAEGLHVPWDLFMRLEELGFDARNRSGHVIVRDRSGHQILRRADLRSQFRYRHQTKGDKNHIEQESEIPVEKFCTSSSSQTPSTAATTQHSYNNVRGHLHPNISYGHTRNRDNKENRRVNEDFKSYPQRQGSGYSRSDSR